MKTVTAGLDINHFEPLNNRPTTISRLELILANKKYQEEININIFFYINIRALSKKV